MADQTSHEQRISATVDAFEAAMARFIARIEEAPAGVVETPPPDGGWSPVGIVWHVAVTNEAFAGLIDGSVPLANAPTDDFTETPFSEIAAKVPDQLEAPEKFHPPAGLSRYEALLRVRASQERLVTAMRAMPASRGLWTVKSILGDISVYQVGEWATAHVTRHNAQAKRTIEKATVER